METTEYTVTVKHHKIVGKSGKRAQQYWVVGDESCTSVNDLRAALLAELQRQMVEGDE
jgi:hypothetical protein